MHPTLPRILWAMALSSAVLASAKMEEWSDIQGHKFKAEASEALGPFAVFRTSSGGGRRLPWRALPPAECARFAAQIGAQREPAAKWTDATGRLTAQLSDLLLTRQGDKLEKADLAARPEPELLLVLFADNAESLSWDMLGKSISPYQTLKERFSHRVEAVQFGIRHNVQDHRNMALHMKVPWLVADFSEQHRVTPLVRLSPARGDFALALLSRHGVPIFSARNPDETAIAKFFADTQALLDLLRPDNPLAWPERAHFLKVVQLARHAQDRAGPLLVGDPLAPEGLRDRGIFRVEARIEVEADGKVAAVALKNDGALPAATATALAEALRQAAVFVPAVEQGRFVAGAYDYLVEVPR